MSLTREGMVAQACARRMAALASLILGAAASLSGAQTATPVLLVHGLNGLREEWADADTRLRNEFPFGQVRVERPQLSGLASVDFMASELATILRTGNTHRVRGAQSWRGCLAVA